MFLLKIGFIPMISSFLLVRTLFLLDFKPYSYPYYEIELFLGI